MPMSPAAALVSTTARTRRQGEDGAGEGAGGDAGAGGSIAPEPKPASARPAPAAPPVGRRIAPPPMSAPIPGPFTCSHG